MSVHLRPYDVEAILRRKIGHKKDKTGIYYYLKWEGYDHMLNTWEPEQNLNCDFLVEQFEANQAAEIAGAKRTPYGVDYLVMFKDGFPMKTFRSVEARAKFPQLVIEFLEDNISVERKFRFNEQLEYADNPRQPITEAAVVIGNPVQISYASKVTGSVMYWAEWPLQRNKFVDSQEASTKWPNLVIDYLEANLERVD